MANTIMVNQYDAMTDMLATTQEFYAYYKEHEAEEDVIDYTYQLMRRVLCTKKWYKETKESLELYIYITDQHVQESHIFTTYYQYIIECLDKEAEKCAVQYYM